MSAYDAVLAMWRVPHEEMDVSTTFGITHINAAGPKDAPVRIVITTWGRAHSEIPD
jgi:hypothetical protein